MKTYEMTGKEFVDVLASKAPTPGGGGAAALCAAIGTALGNMVCALTAGKKKYAEVEEEILEISRKCSSLQSELLELIDADAEAFKPLAAAYSLPTGTEEEKTYKESVLEECSKSAASVPLEIMKKCCAAIDLVERVSVIGSRLAVSDAGCAASILRGSLEAASLNIFINTKSMKDREYADTINQSAKEMLKEYTEKAEEIYQTVFSNLDN